MDPLEGLLARAKIRQLAQRYALAVDGKDLDGIAALFVEGRGQRTRRLDRGPHVERALVGAPADAAHRRRHDRDPASLRVHCGATHADATLDELLRYRELASTRSTSRST